MLSVLENDRKLPTCVCTLKWWEGSPRSQSTIRCYVDMSKFLYISISGTSQINSVSLVCIIFVATFTQSSTWYTYLTAFAWMLHSSKTSHVEMQLISFGLYILEFDSRRTSILCSSRYYALINTYHWDFLCLSSAQSLFSGRHFLVHISGLDIPIFELR